jgi:uncharacterized protein (TIGR02246 family)
MRRELRREATPVRRRTLFTGLPTEAAVDGAIDHFPRSVLHRIIGSPVATVGPMRHYAVALAVVLSVLPCAGHAQARTADSIAILQLVARRAEAIRTRNAELQRPAYAPDAVWINAFGVRRTGRDSIVAFLGGLYADSGFRESRLVRAAPPEVLFIRPDVAVVHDFQESQGQRLRNGEVVDRRVHTTFVMSKEQGRWLIRYQQIADERR